MKVILLFKQLRHLVLCKYCVWASQFNHNFWLIFLCWVGFHIQSLSLSSSWSLVALMSYLNLILSVAKCICSQIKLFKTSNCTRRPLRHFSDNADLPGSLQTGSLPECFRRLPNFFNKILQLWNWKLQSAAKFFKHLWFFSGLIANFYHLILVINSISWKNNTVVKVTPPTKNIVLLFGQPEKVVISISLPN